MTGTFALAGTAFGLGFAYAALPGAVNAEALRRGAAGGFARSFLVHTGAMIGAGCWAALALAGTSLIAENDGVTAALAAAGALFLLRLALIAGRGALAPAAVTLAAARPGADLWVGLLVGVANPAGLPFWTGLASDVVAGGNALSGRRAVVFVGGVLLGSISWGGLLSGLIGWGRRWLTTGFFRAINAVCAFAFGLFAVRLILAAARTLLR